MAGAWRGAVPPEQAVQWRTLRPGSGRLAVALSADGPTRCVRIRDRADPVSTVSLAERPIDRLPVQIRLEGPMSGAQILICFNVKLQRNIVSKCFLKFLTLSYITVLNVMISMSASDYENIKISIGVKRTAVN